MLTVQQRIKQVEEAKRNYTNRGGQVPSKVTYTVWGLRISTEQKATTEYSGK